MVNSYDETTTPPQWKTEHGIGSIRLAQKYDETTEKNKLVIERYDGSGVYS